MQDITKIIAYTVGMGGNHLPFLEIVTDERYDKSINEYVKETQFNKEFYTSLMDGVYKGITYIVLQQCKLIKHSHSSIENSTRYRYVLTFENLSIYTTVEMIEKRDGTEISENEKKLLQEQADKHKNG